MTVEIVPFAAAHVEEASRLCAAVQLAACLATPGYGDTLTNVEAARTLLARLSADPDTLGAVALRDGRPAGYLLGTLFTLPRDGLWSLSIEPGCWGVDPACPDDLLGPLYAAVMARAISVGCFQHFVAVPAGDPLGLERWRSLGFGQDMVHAVRDLRPPATRPDPALRIRPAIPADTVTVARMLEALDGHLARTPVLHPHLPETENGRMTRRHVVAEGLSDSSRLHLLAEQGERVVGVQVYGPPPPRARDVPATALWLADAYTLREARGSGVAAALLAAGVERAQARGHAGLALAWDAANLAGARAWQAMGFHAVGRWLCRRVDERIAWRA